MDKETVRQAFREAGTILGASKLLGIPRRTYRGYVSKGWIDDLRGNVADSKPKAHGSVEATAIVKRPLPKPKKVKRYLLTSAQNNTKLNDQVWKNLLKLADYYKAEIIVGTYTYNTAFYGHAAVKFGTERPDQEPLWYDERLVPYINGGDNQNIELAPGLIWCGRANILPTAERPLSGFETYTGRASGIFPHAKIALESIPTSKFDKTKINYTTGTVTQRNYIQKKAGLKAEHHHTYGALVVEIDDEGTWFVRQLNADSDGIIYDLDLKVEDEHLTTGNRILGINWGDIHVAKRDNINYELNWGRGGVMDTLKPSVQFMHDLIDFEIRNHHNADHYSLFSRHCHTHNSVAQEIEEVGRFLAWARRGYCETVVVNSNHDNALTRWVKECDYRNDPPNAIFFLECQLRKYQAIRDRESFNLVAWALNKFDVTPKNVKYLRLDESYVIGGSIECGMHGHVGANGAKGNPRGLSRIGRKANTGHTHSAAILDGLYVAGVSGKLDQGYNVGPSSWSQSDIITYPNGKRAIITKSNGKWRA
jgi:hypothetical protein